jgi:hypothetical protein
LIGCSIESGSKEWRFSHRDAVGIDPAETAKNGKTRQKTPPFFFFAAVPSACPEPALAIDRVF